MYNSWTPTMDVWVGGWMDGWMDGWMGGWIDGQMDGWMDQRLISTDGYRTEHPS